MLFNDEKYEEFINTKISKEKLDKIEKQYLSKDLNFVDNALEFKFLYSLSKHYIDLFSQSLSTIHNALFLKDDDYYKPIFYVSKAIDLIKKCSVEISSEDFKEYIKRAYVNLGNYYANQYRVYEAIDSYNKALSSDLKFDMAIGNRLLAFEKTAYIADYLEQNKLIYYFAATYSSLCPEEMENGKDLFANKKKHYLELISKLGNTDHFSIYNSNILGETYDEWCLKNRLFLNPLNDMEFAIESAKDIIIGIELLIDKRLKCLFEELYKEYTYNRKKVYNNRFPFDEVSRRELINAFKSLFSIFDKIAYFLYMFFNLELKENEVTYLKVFNGKTKTRSGIALLDIHNTNLYSLFWIKREYRCENDKINVHQYLNEEVRQLNSIRTKLEHRTIVMESKEVKCFPQKALGLLKIIRRALLYLNALVIQETNPALYQFDKRDIRKIYLPIINGENLF